MRKSLISVGLLLLTLFMFGCSDKAQTLENQNANLISSSEENSGVAVNSEGIAEEVKEENEIPEPLRLAGEQLNQGNIDRAKTYLDLVITDFPGTEAEFTARVVKTVIIASEVQSYSYLNKSLGKGIEQISVSLVSLSDIERLQAVLEDNDNNLKSLLKEFEESLVYIYENYESNKDNQLKAVFHMDLKTPEENLAFFEKVGYPVPVNTEINATRKYVYDYYLNSNLEEIFVDDKVDYVNYFYLAAVILHRLENPKYLDEVVAEVIALTENDKYNEKRIDLQYYE